MKGKVMQAALTGGIVWGLTVFLTTLANLYWGYGTAFLKVWESIYPGFNVSLMGSVIGLVYGFLDMFVGIYIIVWVYNLVGKYVK
jgi:hypothetical protein